MLHLNPKDNMENGKFFQHGVNYSSKNSQTGIGTPNQKALRANYSKTRGILNREERFIKDIVKEQTEKIKEEKWNRKINYVLRFSLASVLPQKLTSILYNMPVLRPRNVYNYAKAEWSNIEQGPVSLQIYEERKKICGECPYRKQVEGYTDPLGFCTKCGCGANPRSQLIVKLKLPATSCPINKWGEAKGINDTLWGKIKYILRIRRKQNG